MVTVIPLLLTLCSPALNPAGVFSEMLTLVGTGPLPGYVQILYVDVPLTTGPVSLCPSAALTTEAEGHDGREPEAAGAFGLGFGFGLGLELWCVVALC